MRQVSKFFAIAFAAIIMTAAASAGEPQTMEGSKCLFFGFSGLSTLSVDNSTIGVQYLFADRQGIWADLSFGFGTSKPSENADETKTTAIGFDIGYIWYIFQKGPVACYLSPQFGIMTDSKKYKVSSNDVTESNMSFAVGVSLGAEWWFADNVSLATSAFLGFTSTTNTVEVGSNKTEGTNTQIGISSGEGTGGATLTLSFYF